MRFKSFSRKQLAVMSWWYPGGAAAHRSAVICDGAVRSGKTLCLSVSFGLWAMSCFAGCDFAFCGKSLASLRRNLVQPLLAVLAQTGIGVQAALSRGYLELEWCGRRNRFHLFGGYDEGAAARIQGVTLAGILFDEVALMPRSFVEQGLARCSVEGARYWFSCNPEYPGHWFHSEWILGREGKNAHYIHFAMADNPALPPQVLRRYEGLYSGAFYQRFVLGRWVRAQGAVYPMFSEAAHVVAETPTCGRYVISCDYGTVNPASFGLWGEREGVWYRLREYYHDSRATGETRTDEEHCDALEELAGDCAVEKVIVDPSAASFIQCLRRRRRYRVVPACNRVLDGIRAVAVALRAGKLRFHRGCAATLREFALYRWNEAAREDAPRKEHDHAMDDMRYFVMEMLAAPAEEFFVAAVERKGVKE